MDDEMPPKGPDAEPSNEALPGLTAALKKLENRRVFVPPALDQAILRSARQHLSKPEPFRQPWLRRWLFWPGLAAACILVLGLVSVLIETGWIGHPSPAFASEDVNHDGRVDILDAYQLVRQLERGALTGNELDFNRDGVVDRRDAELIAAHAVKLKKASRS